MLRNLNLLQTRVCHRGFSSSEGFISRAKAHGANALLGAFVHQGKFDQCMKDLTVVSIGDGVVKCTMPVTKEVSNVFNTLHGGATSTLIDVVGTMAVLSKDPVRPGVSVELNTSFVSAAKVGSVITCEGRLLKLGRKLAYTQVDVYGENGKLVATGRHTKAFA
jgi:acyl-coenzyme A thioesterase 13